LEDAVVSETKGTISDERLAATDEGTHGGPQTFRAYKQDDGTYSVLKYFGHGYIGREDGLSKSQVGKLPTKGRVRWFSTAR
jgi:hypothetical protein